MRRSLPNLLGLALLAGLVSPATAAPIFLDDFNDDVGGLVGEVATTGQMWVTGPWGGLETQADVLFGQSGSVGAGHIINVAPGYSDTWVDIGAVLATGAYQLSADIKTEFAGGERNLYLLNAAQNKNVSFKWIGGDIGFEGIYAGHAPVPAGFSTGNIHIDLSFNLDTETGSVSWFDIDDPADVTTSGTVDLGPFTVPLGAGNYEFSRILPFRAGAGVSGFDNLSLTVPSAVAGDFDGDGDVDGADFVAWQTHFPTASGATLADGDADGDGDVDGADFVVWQTNFPFTPGPGVAAVPEPKSIMLMLLAGIIALAWWQIRG